MKCLDVHDENEFIPLEAGLVSQRSITPARAPGEGKSNRALSSLTKAVTWKLVKEMISSSDYFFSVEGTSLVLIYRVSDRVSDKLLFLLQRHLLVA